jgi:hypothetical protein
MILLACSGSLPTIPSAQGSVVPAGDVAALHRLTCDTLPEMVARMDNANGTGQQNLVESFDLIT